MNRTHFAYFAVLFLPLLACAPSSGGQVGEEEIVCQVTGQTPIALDEQSEFGFSGQDLLDELVTMPLDVEWADDATATATLSFSYGQGRAEIQDRDFVKRRDATGEIIEDVSLCERTAVFEFDAALDSSDGRLQERYVQSIALTSLQGLSFSHEFTNFSGTLVPLDLAPAGDWAGLQTTLFITGTGSLFSAELLGQTFDGDLPLDEFIIATFLRPSP